MLLDREGLAREAVRRAFLWKASNKSSLHDVLEHVSVVGRKRIWLLRTDRSSVSGSSVSGSIGDPRKYWVVEPDGIEPTTSCLQSRRSPN